MNIGVTLVVPQQDVIARLETLDEIVFKQQGLVLGVCDRHLDTRHPPQHGVCFSAVRTACEIAADTLAQVARLSPVRHLTVGIQHAVNAGSAGKVFDEGLWVESGHGERVSSSRDRATTLSEMA